MALKEEATALLAKQMDRKDFLKHVGIGLIALTGFSAVVKVLAGESFGKSNTASTSSAYNGYGSSPYGGSKLSN